MSGVACATPVTPSLPSSRLGARLPVGEWLPRADGTSRQKILWCASAQDTFLAGRHKKVGCCPRKISIRDPRNTDVIFRMTGAGKGLTPILRRGFHSKTPAFSLNETRFS